MPLKKRILDFGFFVGQLPFGANDNYLMIVVFKTEAYGEFLANVKTY